MKKIATVLILTLMFNQIGNLMYVKDHAYQFDPNASVSNDESWELGRRTAGAIYQLEQIGYTAYAFTTAAKNLLLQKQAVVAEAALAREGGAVALNKTRERLLSVVENEKLKNAINEIYRPGATIGDGGLADAVRHEMATGELIGGKSHIIKAKERVTNLENILNKQQLNQKDIEIANELLSNLKNALEGK